VNPSALFIDRPVATTLLTIGLVLAGALAYRLLPVAPLPQVDIPTISVSAALSGASPETMAAAVTTPLERSLGRIAGITEMTSTSTLGGARIVIQFDLNRNIDGAARDVQAALNAARNLLPAGLSSSPSYRKVNPSDAPVMILGLTSDTMTQGQMYEAASTIMVQRLSQLRGVGQVQIGGSSPPAVRVDLNPQALHKYGIGLDEVRSAIAATNVVRPKGAVEEGARHWQVGVNDQLHKAADFLPVILAYRGGAAVQLADVAEASDSVQDVRNAGLANGKPAVLVLITRQPRANIIETVDRVRELLPELRAQIPAAIDMKVMMDSTITVRTSLGTAQHTLVLSVSLVFLVVLLFLRNGRAALVAGVAVPVSLIGGFSVMYLAGFSLDNLSLMALTIAAGFVVDDAIVVLENISRHVEAGLPPREAALKGAREVGFTVLAMTLSLAAVFIPMIFMGGYVGLFFREFALTLTITIAISLVVALTTVPMMCARLFAMPARQRARPRWLARPADAIGRAFDALVRGYDRTLGWALAHPGLVMLILLTTIVLNVALYVLIPKGFFPRQDTGQLTGKILADQSISFQAMRQKLERFASIVGADPAVENVVGFLGGAQRNTASMFVALKPLDQRHDSADQVVDRLRTVLALEPGASLILNPVQDIQVGGRQSRSTYQYTLQADDLDQLNLWEPRVRQALALAPELRDVDTDRQSKGLQTSLVVDRDAAARLGITPRQIDSLLNDAFAQRQVSTIYGPQNQYPVVMGVAPEFAQSPEVLDRLQLSGAGDRAVPLSLLSTRTQTETSLVVNHHAQFVASTISFNLAPGVSLSQATAVTQRVLRDLRLPDTVRGSFQGSARAFREALESQPVLITAAFLTLYIVLGVLYESLIHPVTILSTLPSAGVGALLTLMLFGNDFSVIAMIGIFMLIGIVMKNAIMMIDFALQAQRERGLAPREAIHEACLARLRPILMTTLAAFFAAFPLALGTGGGAELRQPLGIAIGGGLVLSQLLTLYTTPVVYLYMDRLSTWLRAKMPHRLPATPAAPAASTP